MENRSFLKGAVWNSLGSVMYGANSFVMLAFASRIGTVEEAGCFGIAFTTSQILYIVGLLGVNHFQQTDFKACYSFNEYRNAKIISCMLMWLGCVGFIIAVHFTGLKLLYTVVLTFLMMLNAVGELYQSLFFQKNRLDLSGAALFFRTFWSLVVFCLISLNTRNILSAVCFQIVVNLCVTLYYRLRYVPKLKVLEYKEDSSTETLVFKTANFVNIKTLNLILECFPLFISMLLMNIVINISKYSVEYQMNDTAQGYYNMIFIIIQVINLCNQFIFKPFLNQYSENVDKGEYLIFIKRILIQFVLVSAFTAVGALAVWCFGPELLGVIYNKDILAYRKTMVYVVIGGGVFAVTQLMYYIFVVLREQVKIMIIYAATTVASGAISYYSVTEYGIDGAAISVICSQLFLLFLYGFTFVGIMKRKILP